jgi:hypothetical protein
MFGISTWEMLILGVICVLPTIAGIIGIGVLVWYSLQKNKKSSSQENEP